MGVRALLKILVLGALGCETEESVDAATIPPLWGSLRWKFVMWRCDAG